MSKLVTAEAWIARHFEPGSEPRLEDLEDWVLSENTGVIIGKKLFINDDALLTTQAHIVNGGKLTAYDLLAR
jgi:hypothetical protein